MIRLAKPALVACAVLALAGCEDRNPRPRADTGNPDVSASLLATVDGCRVWKLREIGGRDVYVATCGSSSKSQWTESCGKSCTRDLHALTLRSGGEDH